MMWKRLLGKAESVTPLRAAFERARATNTMAGVLPVFVGTDPLFVVSLREGEQLNVYIKESSTPERWCVTVAEKREFLDKVPAELVNQMSVRQLLERMVGAWDIVVVYATGGDVLQAEYLPDLRELVGANG